MVFSFLTKNCEIGGGYANVEAEGIWEIYVPPSQFCYKSKAALKRNLKNGGNNNFAELLQTLNEMKIKDIF